MVVVGQVARDLALLVDAVPPAEEAADLRQRREVLGGKGANQAVGLAQLGLRPVLIGVVGDDAHGVEVLDRADRDGIDTGCVVRRPNTATGLIVDVVDGDAQWRYLQDLPPAVLLTPSDVSAAAAVLRAADVVVLQLQQPLEAVLAAADLASRATVVLDGAAPDPSARKALLAHADVIRADAQEARSWTDAPLGSPAEVLSAARELVASGPSLVVLDAGEAGNAAAWADGAEVVPLLAADVVDPTGGGDAYIAGLVWTLDRGPAEAVRWAAAAAACTVEHLGGRPALTPDVLRARRAT